MAKKPLDSYMFHTVYLSYEEGPTGRSYVGKHSTDDPYDDYFGSFHDSSFNPVGKHVLGMYKTPQGATRGEIMWQRVLHVVEDPHYVNRAYQTAIGFDTTGRKRPKEETAPGGLAMKGMLVWNNGVAESRSKTCPGPEWVRGKLPFTDKHRQRISEVVSSLLWWNNGSEETRSQTQPGLNWVEGRLKIPTNTQLWQCTVTGHISTAGPLSRYQRARGVDTSNRRRISQ